MIHPEMIREILSSYSLDVMGIHGISHWGRVLENGLKLAENTGANPKIVTLFAVFHDSRRANDSHDPGHGERGSKLVEAFRENYLSLSDKEFERLQYACEKHTDGVIDEDVDIQTCWDSDRLDLWRVGITPRADFLSPNAQDESIYGWAKERSLSGYTPECVSKWLKSTTNH